MIGWENGRRTDGDHHTDLRLYVTDTVDRFIKRSEKLLSEFKLNPNAKKVSCVAGNWNNHANYHFYHYSNVQDLTVSTNWTRFTILTGMLK
jgi:hypothetical protein